MAEKDLKKPIFDFPDKYDKSVNVLIYIIFSHLCKICSSFYDKSAIFHKSLIFSISVIKSAIWYHPGISFKPGFR